jgi:tetraacyldisaccharide 4'-kinase
MAMLPDAETFKRLVDGSTRGPGPAAARLALAAVSLPYAVAVAARNLAYDAGLLPTGGVELPVISIGNLTLGGTGKTPLVAWVARLLGDRGIRPAIVSRGYAARPGERSDEGAELGILLPGVGHVEDRDRVAGSRTAVAAGAGAIVLDDGFQHRRLRRDLDIVAVDATDPFGCGHLFPRGLLREPLRSLRRADAVVLTRAGTIAADRRAAIRTTLTAACGGRIPGAWMEAEHRPVGLRSSDGTVQPLEELRGRRITAFAGIGNPAGFRGTLASLAAEVVDITLFPDHHPYGSADLDRLAARIAASKAEMAVTTLKDLVKIRRTRLGGIPLVAIEIAMHPLAGGDEVAGLIGSVVTHVAAPQGPTP